MLNDTLIRVLQNQPIDRMPIWIMRQAGRYLPQYRELRRNAGSFVSLMKSPELSSTATIQPLEQFDLDAAIIFSDILTIPDGMGLGLQFSAGEGPSFKRPIKVPADIKRLFVTNGATDYPYLLKAISITLDKLDNSVPLIGFSGSPYTIAKYMFADSESINSWRKNHRESLNQLLRIIAASVENYLAAQIAAGVSVVQIFDSWGHTLDNEKDFKEFSVSYLKKIVANLSKQCPHIPIIIYSRQNNLDLLSLIAETKGLSCLSVNSDVNLAECAEQHPHLVFQGNFNPLALTGDSSELENEFQRVIKQIKDPSRHIFNLGQGITPEGKPDLVTKLIDKVHSIQI